MVYAHVHSSTELGDENFTIDPMFDIGDDSPEFDPLKPMLATKTDLNKLSGEVFVQPKLDGIRAIWHPQQKALFTRNGNKITSCNHIVEAILASGCERLCMDGEIYNHYVPFDAINGLVRKKQAEHMTLSLDFHVFDLIDPRKRTTVARMQRLRLMDSTLSGESREHIKVITTDLVKARYVKTHYYKYLDNGYEGIIVRDPDSHYVHGRTKSLGKIKPKQDMEATLIGFEKATTKLHADTFGSMFLQLPSGVIFKCSNLTHAQRKKIWQEQSIGHQVTFLYEGLTGNGKPRFPRFKAIRFDTVGGVQ